MLEGIGHGQMEGKTRRIDVAFMNGEFDVLVATTIIGGLDVPNANTIFINNANILVCLICIKCDVGRSNKKAFCYFLLFYLSAVFSHDDDA
jgi:transcription-repair coupling factor (superfamily II helicase)